MSNRKANARRLRYFRTFRIDDTQIIPFTHSFTPINPISVTPKKMTTEERKALYDLIDTLVKIFEFEHALKETIDESVENAIREAEPSAENFEKVW